MWISTANRNAHRLILNNDLVELEEQEIAQVIKQKLKSNSAVQKVFKQFDISLDQLDNLNIEFTDLDGKYANTDGETMEIDRGLLEDRDFFKKYMFVCNHEVVHYLSRKSESFSYWNDPEETLGFTISIASELSEGTPLHEIWKKIYPKVKWHFNNEKDAELFFKRMIQKAKSFV